MNASDRLADLRVNPNWAKLPLFDRKGWRTMKFGNFADSVNERVEPADAADEPYVGLDDLDSGDLHIRRWGKGSDVIGTKLRFRKGDIIFGRRRAYQRKLAVAEFDGICSAHAMVVRAKPALVLPEFLPFLMMSDRFMKRAVEISVGSLSPTINWTTLRLEEFDLPPLEQQRRIAPVMTAIDAIEETHAALQENALKARRAAIDEEIAEAVVKKQLPCKAVMSMQNGRPFPSADYQESGVRLIRPGNLGIDGYLAWKPDATAYLPSRYGDANKDWHIGPDQVLINLTAQSLDDGFMGRVCYTRNEDAGLLNQRIGRFVVRNGFIPEYIFRCLQTTRFRNLVESRCEGSKVRHIYFRHFEDYPIPDVSPSKQRAICERINSVELAADHIDKARKHCVSLRSMLLGELIR